MDSPSEFDSSWGICSASTVTSSVSESSLSSVTISLNTRVECSVDSGTSKIATCLSDEIVVKTLLISSHSYGFLSPTVLTCCSWLSGNGNSIYVKTNSRTLKYYYCVMPVLTLYENGNFARESSHLQFQSRPLIFLHLPFIHIP